MKHLLLTILLCLCAATLYAQTDKVEGVGKFKVGKTTLPIIAELETELSTKVQLITTFRQESSTDGETGIFELIPDTVQSYGGPIGASQCRKARVFLLPKYTVAGIALNHVTLKFLNGTLVEFQCRNATELYDALVVKYGKGRTELKESSTSCTLRLTGAAITRTGQTLTEGWGTEKMPANYVISKYYDSNCQEQFLAFFYVSDLAATKEIKRCEDLSIAQRKAATDAAKRKKLGDL